MASSYGDRSRYLLRQGLSVNKAAQPIPRTALIGCGRWGRNIARVLARLGALEIIVDPAIDALQPYADELGCRLSADIEQAFAENIGALAIAAPAVDHATLARRALKARKPIFVEKPLALDLEEAAELTQLARESGLPLMVGHLLQYHPAFVTLKRMVAAGEIGELRHVTSNRLNPGAIRTEENALWSMAPHDFSMMLGLAGEEPSAVSTLATRVVNPLIPDQYSVQLRFPSGLTGQVNVSWLSPFKEHRLVVLGAKGALVFDDTAPEPERKLVIFRDYIDRSATPPRFIKHPGEAVEWPAGEPLEAEMRAFLDAANGGDLCRTGPEEALPVLRLLHRAGAATLEA
jgi:predicted dehydrogenase